MKQDAKWTSTPSPPPQPPTPPEQLLRILRCSSVIVRNEEKEYMLIESNCLES